MNYSQYIIYWPYRLVWNVVRLGRKLMRKDKDIVFYCGTPVDYVGAKNVIDLLPRCRIVAKNRKVREDLIKNYGVTECGIYPTFPDVLIAARHIARKFPEKRMQKIGMRHGAYHFKDFVSARRYNAFDCFLVTSQREVELARERGINNAVAVGFPKLDNAFNGKISAETLNALRSKLDIKPAKPTVIFTATWEKSGMSAIDKWACRLSELVDKYNVLVTLHAWVTEKNRTLVRRNSQVHYIETKDILPYLMISDVMVGDISSIIAEFCALDKPIISFRTPRGRRASSEIIAMLDRISYRVDNFEELQTALEKATANPGYHSKARHEYNRIMFDKLDGNAGVRAADYIKAKFLSEQADSSRGIKL